MRDHWHRSNWSMRTSVILAVPLPARSAKHDALGKTAASVGSSGAASMRLMIDAKSPEALWLALRMVHAVLRESPSALACSSSVRGIPRI